MTNFSFLKGETVISSTYQKSASRSTRRSGKIGRQFAESSSPTAKGSRSHSRKSKKTGRSKPPAPSKKRTPDPAEPLVTVGQLQIADAAELKSLMADSMRSFAVEMGLQVAACLLEDDVTRLCGKKNERVANRTHNRHGSQPGYVILNGQKVAIDRPRVRTINGEEVRSDVYDQLQAEDAMPAAALMKMLRGVSCRDYEDVVETARSGYGVKKSSVSKHFVAASARQLEEFDSRAFHETTFAAVFIDGIAFAGEMMVAAMGVSTDGSKRVLGIRQGETENAELVTSLLTDLRDRGVRTDQPTLFCLDGSKALRAGVTRVFGDNAIVQRCQIHKRRNVEGHTPKRHHDELRSRLKGAWSQSNYETAKTQMNDTVAWLRTINRDAANSLLEGLEETLTVIRLGLTGDLRRFFATTNAIESMFSRCRDITHRVKRWRDGDMRHRWCVSGLLRAEEGFRRIRGFKNLSRLIDAMKKLTVDNQTSSR